ncbi:MAG: hypothetical protein O3B86_01075, partial [Planctomycetota bacterium]|nr:hypothetical protein [Planctomycetota bacterium]
SISEGMIAEISAATLRSTQRGDFAKKFSPTASGLDETICSAVATSRIPQIFTHMTLPVEP